MNAEVASGGQTAIFDLEGTGGLDFEAEAFRLAVVGEAVSATAPELTLPLEVELRIIENMLYLNLRDPDSGELSGWAGDSLNDLAAAFARTLAAGTTVNPDDFAGDVGLPEIFAAVPQLNSAFDPAEFVGIERLTNTTIDTVNVTPFTIGVSLSDLFNSDFMPAVVGGLLAQLPETAEVPGEVIAPMLGLMVEDSTFDITQYVDSELDLVRRTTIALALNLDPSVMGATGDPVGINFTFDIDLNDFGTAPVIEAPADAQIGLLVQALQGPGATPPPTGGNAEPTLPSPTAVVPSPAQPDSSSALTISANTPLEVAFANAPVQVVYDAAAAETVTITARSVEGDLDTTLTVLDEDGEQLAFNDDHNSERDLATFDSLIVDLQLSAAGKYILQVDTFSGSGDGVIELVIETEADSPTAQPTVKAGETGDLITLEGEFGSGESFETTFEGTQGDVVSITARATDNNLDTVLELVGPDGDIAAENDDHGTSDTVLARYDSRIERFELPETGTYTVVVRGFAGGGGTFELTIQRGDDGGQTQAPAGDVIIIEENLRSGDVYSYTLEASAGDVYTITVRGLEESMDPVVSMYAPDGSFLFSNDDHGGSDVLLNTLDARIERFIMQESGDYTIEVYGYQDASGNFELIIEPIAQDAPLGSGQDEVFTGEINANGTFTQDFEAEAGQYITITVRALTDNFDASTALFSSDGVLLASNDDHGSSDANLSFLDSRISNYLITQSGTYTVEVVGYGDSAGTFALIVNVK
ncbi:MAG: hypothetical protein SF162_01305 [bacterium]|nr:hypothetical protein [bacterium]